MKMKTGTFHLATVLLIGALAFVGLGIAFSAEATVTPEPDQCGEEHTYTFSSDSASTPANVDFINTGSPGNPDSITVTADSGFVITKVELSVDDDGESGFHTYATGPVTSFNPNPGTGINVAKVTVKKICPDLCPNLEGDQYEVPEGLILDGGQCIVPPPPDVCPNLEGAQESVPEGYHLEEGQCVQDPPEPVDLCPNIDEVQETVPEGYEIVEGNCVLIPPPPVDVCENIPELQETIPEGYESLEAGQCTLIPPPPVDVCENLDGTQEVVPEGYESLTEGQCTPIPAEPVDVCPNLEGTQETVPEGYELDEENQCVLVETEEEPETTPESAPAPTGGGGGGGGPIGCPFGVGCNSNQPTTPSEPVTTQNPGGNGEVLGTSCGPLLTTYMRLGKQNNSTEVDLLENFLNQELGLSLTIDGMFDTATHEAVKEFQEKYADEVLTPWGLTEGTGYVYILTKWKVNQLSCPTGEEAPSV